MYAIIDDRGHQYKVEQGDRLEIQLMDLPEGQDSLSFDRVLMVADEGGEPKIGTPTVEGASVTAKILGEVKGDKIVVQKFRRRTTYARRTGHRQHYLQVQIDSINA